MRLSPQVRSELSRKCSASTVDRFDTLLLQADNALYRAKNWGRNQVAV